MDGRWGNRRIRRSTIGRACPIMIGAWKRVSWMMQCISGLQGLSNLWGEALPDSPRFHHTVAGLVALADWIGSDRRFFDFAAPFDLAYGAIARTAALPALATIGIDLGQLAARTAPGFEELTGFDAPNAAQTAVGNVDPAARLVILESETGSGKTEAALWHFTRLLAKGSVSGLYFAVPTRAAAGQLHGRVHKALRRAFGEQAPEAVLAIPGLLRAGDFRASVCPIGASDGTTTPDRFRKGGPPSTRRDFWRHPSLWARWIRRCSPACR